MDMQLTDEQIINAFKAAGVEFMTVYNLNENADVYLTVGSQKASKIIAAARALLSQQVEAARNAALESEVVRLNAIIDYYGCDDSDAGCVAAINRAQAEQKGNVND